MHHHVVDVLGAARALLVVSRKGPVPEQSRVGDTVPSGESEAVGGERIPLELAADAKAADVATQYEILARR